MERHSERLQKEDRITNEIVSDLLRTQGNATAYLEFVRMELDRDAQLMQTVEELSRTIADGVFEPIVERKKYAQAFEYGAMLGLHIAQKEVSPLQFQTIATALTVANEEINQAAQSSIVDLKKPLTGDEVYEYWQYFFNHSILEEGVNNYDRAEKYQFIVNKFGDFFVNPDDLRLGLLFYGGFGYMHGLSEDLEASAPRHAA